MPTISAMASSYLSISYAASFFSSNDFAPPPSPQTAFEVVVPNVSTIKNKYLLKLLYPNKHLNDFWNYELALNLIYKFTTCVRA